MRNKHKKMILFGFYFLASQPIGAAILVGGDINQISPPNSVLFGDTESNTAIVFFEEQSNIVISEPTAVDIITPGNYSSFPSEDITLAAGTRLNSFFIHFDPVGTDRADLRGTIVFETSIIGVIVDDENLDLTDSIFGSVGTSYPFTLVNRGLEGLNEGFSTGNDTLVLSNNLRSLTIEVNAQSVHDQIRVLTAIPIFPSGWLLVSGLIALVGFLPKSRQR